MNLDSQNWPRARKRQAGYSLPEVLVSLAILGFLFAAISRGLDFAARLSASNTLRESANELLQSESEYLRGLEWSEVANVADDSPFASAGGGTPFSTTRSVATLADGLRSIRLTIRWTDARGQARELDSIVLVAAGGLST